MGRRGCVCVAAQCCERIAQRLSPGQSRRGSPQACCPQAAAPPALAGRPGWRAGPLPGRGRWGARQGVAPGGGAVATAEPISSPVSSTHKRAAFPFAGHNTARNCSAAPDAVSPHNPAYHQPAKLLCCRSTRASEGARHSGGRGPDSRLCAASSCCRAGSAARPAGRRLGDLGGRASVQARALMLCL